MLSVWITIVLLSLSSVSYAVHITDKLLAGMYAEPSIENAPIQLLPSGTPLELKTEKDGFVKVQLVGGKEGWVEKRFLSDDKPANVRLLALQSKYRQQQTKLDVYEKELLELKKAKALPVKANESQLSRAMEIMEAELAAVKKEKFLLMTDNKKLSDDIKGSEGDKPTLTLRAVVVEEQAGSSGARLSVWFWLLLMPIGIVGGLYWGMRIQDERQRKKHGGFRI